MQLSRESIQRMIGSGKGLTVGYGGSSSGGIGGGVSIPYYNQNFELLYKKVVTDGTTGTVTTQYLTAAPNEIVNVGSETDPSTGDVTVTTIVGPKAKTALVIGDAMLVWDAQNSAVYVINRDGTTAANFYATGGVSALGYSAGGGGGGGVSALTDLLDVQISSPSNGQALVYDTSLSPAKWVNKTIFESMTYGSNVLSLTISGVTRNVTIQAGTSSVDWANITNKPNTATRWPTFAEVTSKPTTLGGYGITDAYISNGTIYLGSNSITPVTSLYGYATQDWVSQQGYLTSSAISDMATKTWVQQQGYLTSSAISDMATKTWVGQQGYLTSSAISDMATKTWTNDWFVKDAGGNLGSGDKIYSIGCKRIFSGYDMPDAPVDNAWVSGIALGSNWNDNHYQHYLVESGDRWYTTREYSSGSMSGWKTFAYLTDNVASATKLQTARTIWGQIFDGTANISGGISGASNIEFTSITSNAGHGGYIDFHFNGASGDYTSRIIESASGMLNINYGMFVRGNTTYIGSSLSAMDQSYRLHVDGASYISNTAYFGGQVMQDGGYFLMHCMDGGSAAYGLMIEGLAQTGNEIRSTFGFHPAGRNISYSDGSYDMTVLSIRYNLSTHDKYAIINNYLNVRDHVTITSNNGYIQIGDGRLVWDSTNNALKVIKSDGTAANLYTTGGVSALGMSAGVSSIDSMTFNNLSVKNSMTLNGSVNIITGSSSQIVRTSNDSDCIYLLNFSGTSKETSHNYYYNQYDNIGLHGTNYNYDETWFIDPDGCAKFNRLYLDSVRYLYINGGTLYYYNGSTARQVAMV